MLGETLTTHQLRQLANQTTNSKSGTERVLSTCLLHACDQIDRLSRQHREATALIGKLSSELAMHDRRERRVETRRMVDL